MFNPIKYEGNLGEQYSYLNMNYAITKKIQ